MVNNVEISFIRNIIENNLLFYKTKVTQDCLTDIFCKVIFNEIGKNMATNGGFIPHHHLKNFVEDKKRMEKYKDTKYPLAINDVGDILSFINDNSIDKDFSVIEKTILNEDKKRKMVNLTSKIMEKLGDSKENINELIRKLSFEIDSLKYDSDDDLEFYSLKELVENELKYQESDEVEKFYDFGWNIIDDEVGGIPKPSTNYILAPPKTGKSSSLYDLANKSLNNGSNVLFVTIEIPTREALRKIYANLTNLKYKEIVSKTLSKEDGEFYIKSLSTSADKFDNHFYMIYNKNGVDVKQIEDYITNLKKSGIEIDVVYIDYLTLLNSVDDKKKSDVEKFMSLPKEVRVLSQKTNTAIISAGQLDVSTIKKDISEITLDDMHYVKNALSQEATNVLFLNQDLDDIINEKPSLKIKHLLGRNGLNIDVYHFPKYDYDRVYFGGDKKYTNKEAKF